jgi:hypothetical protein
VSGPCETVNSKNRPIYLLHAEGMVFKENTTNSYICDADDQAIFSVEVETSDQIFNIKYQ